MSLTVFIGLCLAVSAIGGAVTSLSVDTWYRALAKPSFNPPDWVFAPVWTVLYLMIALAGWCVWQARRAVGDGHGEGTRTAMTAYGVQLMLNLAWSCLFFGGRMIGAALADIILLLAAIVVNALLFARINRLAAWLLAPYAVWVTFAAILNFAIWRLN